ncbi:MAG: hypothetical protein ACRC5C_07595, partial [Bacilli bacterium]
MKNKKAIVILVILCCVVLSVGIASGLTNSADDEVRSKIKNQWALSNSGQMINEVSGRKGFDVNAIGAWDITLGDSSVVIGVLDTGIQITNPNIAQSIFVNTKEIPDNNVDDDRNGYADDINGWDFYNQDATVYDDVLSDYHGTF